MNLSTSTNIISHPRKGETLLSVQECVELCAAQGYQVMDINCCDCAEPGFPLTMDDWQRWTEKLAKFSKALGVTYSQSHNPIYNMLEPSEVEDFAWQEELSDRCLIAAAMLGVKLVVVHAGTALPGGVYNRRMTLEKNAELMMADGLILTEHAPQRAAAEKYRAAAARAAQTRFLPHVRRRSGHHRQRAHPAKPLAFFRCSHSIAPPGTEVAKKHER